MNLSNLLSGANLLVKDVATFKELDVKVLGQTLTPITFQKPGKEDETELVTAWGMVGGVKARLSIFDDAKVFVVPGKDSGELRCRVVEAEPWVEEESKVEHPHYKVFRLGASIEGEAGNLFGELFETAGKAKAYRESVQVAAFEVLKSPAPFVEQVTLKDKSTFSRLVCFAAVTTVTKEGLFEGETVRLEIGEKAELTLAEGTDEAAVNISAAGTCFHGVARNMGYGVAERDEEGRLTGHRISVVRLWKAGVAMSPVEAEAIYEASKAK